MGVSCAVSGEGIKAVFWPWQCNGIYSPPVVLWRGRPGHPVLSQIQDGNARFPKNRGVVEAKGACPDPNFGCARNSRQYPVRRVSFLQFLHQSRS